MNTRLLKGKLGKLTMDGLDFVRIKPDGTRIVRYTAPDKETAMKIAQLLDGVSAGGMMQGYRLGIKNGIKIGVVVGVATTGIITLYAICKAEKKAKEKTKENEEA